jgi:hypothetical protein
LERCAADGTASSGTTTPTSAMSTSTGLNVAGYILQFLTVLYIIYIFAYYDISNLVMNFASGMFIISISWIKLLIKLAKFPIFFSHNKSADVISTQ